VSENCVILYIALRTMSVVVYEPVIEIAPDCLGADKRMPVLSLLTN
jgi:hypothetical protein